LAVQPLLAKIFHATPPASVATHVLVSSARSAVVDVTAAAITVVVVDALIGEAAPTAVVDVPIAVDAPSLAARVSNSVRDPADQDTNVVIREAAPVPRAVPSSFPKC
jgi:hypothetical protein